MDKVKDEGFRLAAFVSEMKDWLPHGTQSMIIETPERTYKVSSVEGGTINVKIWTKAPWENLVRCEEPLAKGFPLSYSNKDYIVHCKPMSSQEGDPIALWLSIRNTPNTAAAHDWRSMQRIKNEIVGSQVDAIEIYPAESKLVDSCNQFHLWCLPPGMSIPMGYQKRDVLSPEQALEEFGEKVKQRAFESHHNAEGLEAIGPAWSILWPDFNFEEEK